MDLLYRLRDESEREETFVARGSLPLEEQVAVEPEARRADLLQAREVDEQVGAEASQDASNAPKEALGVIDITESPSFIESMYNEDQTVKERPNEGVHRANNPLR